MIASEVVQVLALLVAPSGAAWAGVKLALNGTHRRIQVLADKIDGVDGKLDRTREELAFLRGRFQIAPPEGNP